jgi:hypothetical protein
LAERETAFTAVGKGQYASAGAGGKVRYSPIHVGFCLVSPPINADSGR